MIKQFLFRLSQLVFVMTFVLMLLAMIGQTSWHLYKYFTGVYSPAYGFFGEMLINYQGGFVRRGLLGEVLFLVRGVLPFDVIDAVLLVYYGSFVLIVLLLLRLFKQHGWSIFLLPFPVFLYEYLCDPYIICCKRDCLILLFAYVGFYMYRRFVNNPTFWGLLYTNIFLIIGGLIHEAFFVFCAFIIIYHFYFKRCQATPNRFSCFLETLICWSPTLLALLGVGICSGQSEQAVAIIDSWNQYVELGNPTESYVYRTLGQMKFDDVVTESLSHWFRPFCGLLPVWPVNIFVGICLYYLVTRMNIIDLGTFPLIDMDVVQLSNILLFQFLILLPFSLLMHDLARLLPYWSISSLFFMHFFPNRNVFPSMLSSLSDILQRQIDRIPVLNKQWVYLLILILLPIGYMGANLTGMFPFIPNEMKHWIMGIPMFVNY